jgi:large subunit ribosomal protein L21
MYAVVSDRNQQFRAVPGERVLIPLHPDAEPGSTLTFDQVCLVGGDENNQPKVGLPFIDGARVVAKVLGAAKGPKLVVAKYRRRKNSRRRTGFRARFTEIEIQSVQL